MECWQLPFESQIVIWATSLLFVPETPAHFIRWAVIHLGLSVEGGILAAITRTSILFTRNITTTSRLTPRLEIFNHSNDLRYYNMWYWDIQSQQWSRFCSSRGAWVVARDQPSWPGFDRCHQDNVAMVNLQRFLFAGVLPDQAQFGREQSTFSRPWWPCQKVEKI